MRTILFSIIVSFLIIWGACSNNSTNPVTTTNNSNNSIDTVITIYSPSPDENYWYPLSWLAILFQSSKIAHLSHSPGIDICIGRDSTLDSCYVSWLAPDSVTYAQSWTGIDTYGNPNWFRIREMDSTSGHYYYSKSQKFYVHLH